MFRTAMEKMKGIYAKNPQLGDVQQVSQQLLETQERIDNLAAEKEEFQASTFVTRSVKLCIGFCSQWFYTITISSRLYHMPLSLGCDL